jgi:hypothetical protein
MLRAAGQHRAGKDAYQPAENEAPLDPHGKTLAGARALGPERGHLVEDRETRFAARRPQEVALEQATAHAAADGTSLNRLAVSATTHCLTGCAIGEVAGMAIATAFGWGNLASIIAAVVLAYFFGFGLTAMPLVRAGLAAGVIVSTALAADTVSITIMEAIDNLTVILIPNAIDAGLGDALFYASIAGGFAIAYPFAFLANRYLIARGRGHAIVHEYHGH